MCTKHVRRTNINLSKSNFYKISNGVGRHTWCMIHECKVNDVLIIYDFNTLSLLRVC